MQLNLTVDLTPLKLAATKFVDEGAEATRASIITLGSGQSMAYLEKRGEAEVYLANYQVNGDGEVINEPGQWTTPHIYAEAAAKGISRFSMAQAIVTSAFEWSVMSSRIEAIRISTKDRIDAATTPAAIEALKAVDWTQIYV